MHLRSQWNFLKKLLWEHTPKMTAEEGGLAARSGGHLRAQGLVCSLLQPTNEWVCLWWWAMLINQEYVRLRNECLSVCMFVSVCVCLYEWVCVFVYVSECVCVCLSMCVCVCLCEWVCVCVYVFVYVSEWVYLWWWAMLINLEYVRLRNF